MFEKYYSALIGDGRHNRPTYDETRQDLQRMYLARTLGSGWDAGLDRRNLRRL